MKEMQWGFIGCGNMAKAMIRGMVEHHAVEAAQVMASDALAAAMEPLHWYSHRSGRLDRTTLAKVSS